jgi:cold shock CspA family protein
MQGTMLWFNAEKGYGYIETEQEERLYVARSGFLPDHEPAARCKGRPVRFDRELVDGEACAVSVSFVMESDPRRARLRHSRGGKSL